MRRSLALVSIFGALCACETGSRKEPAPEPVPAAPPASPADLAPLSPSLEPISAPSAGGSADASPVTVGFDWGPPCRVPAVQDVEKDGIRARFAFDVVLERGATGLVAKLDRMRSIALPGQRGQLGPAVDRVLAALDGSIPPIAVADTGESQGAVDIDRAIDAMLAVVATTVKDVKTEVVAKLLRSPQWKAALQQKAGETWDAWVGTWTSMELTPNSEQRETIDLPTAMGTFHDVPITITHHGSVRGAPELALLSVEQKLEGPELASFLGGFVKDAAKQVGAPPTGMPAFRHARKTDRITVAIDAARGRPHRSRHVMTIEVEDKRKQTVRDTAFDWSRAIGCVAVTPPSASGSALR